MKSSRSVSCSAPLKGDAMTAALPPRGGIPQRRETKGLVPPRCRKAPARRMRTLPRGRRPLLTSPGAAAPRTPRGNPGPTLFFASRASPAPGWGEGGGRASAAAPAPESLRLHKKAEGILAPSTSLSAAYLRTRCSRMQPKNPELAWQAEGAQLVLGNSGREESRDGGEASPSWGAAPRASSTLFCYLGDQSGKVHTPGRP